MATRVDTSTDPRPCIGCGTVGVWWGYKGRDGENRYRRLTCDDLCSRNAKKRALTHLMRSPPKPAKKRSFTEGENG